MAKIYVFGVSPFAEMLRFYIEEDGDDEFAGYVVDQKYMPPDNQIGGYR